MVGGYPPAGQLPDSNSRWRPQRHAKTRHQTAREISIMAWSTREMAELAGVSLRAVRHCHDIRLLEEPERRSNGYKQYGVSVSCLTFDASGPAVPGSAISLQTPRAADSTLPAPSAKPSPISTIQPRWTS
ncbi:hypothetical protein GCM10010424_29910 [Streptomyces lienomycini]